MATRTVDNTVKYPINIQKLFQPKLPFPWKQPIDYQPQQRRSAHIDPIYSYKDHLAQYLVEHQPSNQPSNQPDVQQLNAQRAKERRNLRKEAFVRQQNEWEDPEVLQKTEREVMKDPYKTVFVSRLPYELTELEVSNSFKRYGQIESIRIVRDKQGKPKGYGFIVFERDMDAQECIKDLASSGLRMKNRTILVDMERGRLVRGWKPRRLGGGLGGRHYTKPNALHSNTASAAASGRRLHLQSGVNGPSNGPRRRHFRDERGQIDVDKYRASERYREPPRDYRSDRSIRDGSGGSEVANKYAKYGVSGKREERTIRNIRGRN